MEAEALLSLSLMLPARPGEAPVVFVVMVVLDAVPLVVVVVVLVLVD